MASWRYHHCPGCGATTPRDALVLPFTCDDCGYLSRRVASPQTGEPHRDGRSRVGLGGNGYHIQKAAGAQ